MLNLFCVPEITPRIANDKRPPSKKAKKGGDANDEPTERPE